MIEVKNIKKSFGEKKVLQDVSCVLESSKVNLIIGTSGSGKTVFLKCLVGLLEVDAGEILYEGVDFVNMAEKDRKELRTQIGMLFQGSALFDSLTVEQNIMFPLDMFTKKTFSEKKKRVNEVLERVNLVDVNHKYPAELSGGMKKRVALARAIVLNPKYLYCDEPNSGLDPKTSIVIDKLIKEITAEYKITTIMNTHDMNTVMESGDNIIYLLKGYKQWEGSKDDIIFSEDKDLNEFIFASEFLQEAKKYRMIQARQKEHK
jgi:phospholipid/cholesterol/gamma-HCH transport system ATP-binding protein